MSRDTHTLRSATRVAAGAALALLGGCSLAPKLAPQPPVAAPIAAKSKPSADANNWIAQAWEGWQRAQSSPIYEPNPSARLALKAPKPLSPDSLGRIELAPDASAMRIAGPSGVLSTGFPGAPTLILTNLDGSTLTGTSAIWKQAARDFESASAASVGANAQNASLAAGDWSTLQRAAQARQGQALQDLALRVASQRRAAANDEEGLLRADLNNDLERVGRVDLDALVPALPPRSELDRLTNLRLKLLSTLAIAPAQQRQAQAEVERIETQIRALLRQQEIERAALLGTLRREVPARLQSQRDAAIQKALQQAQGADASAITTLLQDQQRRVRLDFAASTRLSIPIALSQPASSTDAAGTQISFNKNQLRTFATSSPSGAPIAPLSAQAAQVLAPRSARARVGQNPDAGVRNRAQGGENSRWQALQLKRARAWRVRAR